MSVVRAGRIPDRAPHSAQQSTVPSPEQHRALAIVRAQGWNGSSFQVLARGYSYHFDGDAFVAYVDTGTSWVAAGAPVGAQDRIAEVAERFRDAAREAGRNVCFFSAGSRFVAETPGWKSLVIGEQPIWRTATWRDESDRKRSLGAQVRRARAKGVVVRRIEASRVRPGTDERRMIDDVLGEWLESRRMPPMGFLVDVQPFVFGDERRIFRAERDGVVVALLVAAPIYARNGWLVETLARRNDAPNGTSEALIDAAMNAAASESVDIVTLGMAPLAGTTALRLRLARWLTRPFYDFDGLYAFRRKLRPDAWEPLYLVVPPKAPRWLALVESLRAFAHGSITRFALRSLLRLITRRAVSRAIGSSRFARGILASRSR
ncbi:hypothetical protein BH09MYX1_BH09MYX1_42410 [soil metagenome]